MNKKEILQFIEPMMDKLEYCIEFTEIRKTYDLVEIFGKINPTGNSINKKYKENIDYIVSQFPFLYHTDTQYIHNHLINFSAHISSGVHDKIQIKSFNIVNKNYEINANTRWMYILSDLIKRVFYKDEIYQKIKFSKKELIEQMQKNHLHLDYIFVYKCITHQEKKHDRLQRNIFIQARQRNGLCESERNLG